VKISIGTSDLPIQAMTAHGSKGLEYDYVYIMYANEEYWMGRERPKYFALPELVETNSEDSTKDVRRLFYVAITRAKKHVSILYAGEEVGGRHITPLRFIDELDSNHVKHLEIDKLYDREESYLEVTKKNTNSKFNKKLLDYAKNIVMEKGISVTALNHYLNCPSEFMVKSILKLPEAKAPLAEKGTALHYAFKEAWSYRSENKSISVKQLQDILHNSVIKFMKESSLSKADREIVLSDLISMIPAISLSMHSHFEQEGNIYSESWSQYTFDVDQMRIPIHGKLDAIIDTGKDVIVYDYKTRKKMSVAEIKGETKNSDGNYFRQLIFYHLLIQNDHRFSEKNILPTLAFIVPDNSKPIRPRWYTENVWEIEPTEKIVEIFAYCLMPNHFHIGAKEIKENGINKFICRLITGRPLG
jgi:DNA helicase-2/ATP-dependent DNA helicase PcrA